MTPTEKAVETRQRNKEKREAREIYHRELNELLIMNLQKVLEDDLLSGESRLKAVTLIDEFRKELRI